MTTRPDMTDAEITELLRSVVDDPAMVPPNRAAIRARLLDGQSITSDRSTVIDFDPHRVERRHRLGWGAAASIAAAAVVAITLGTLTIVRDAPEPPAASTDTIPTPRPTLSLDSIPVPSELPAARYVSSLAGGVVFEIAQPVTIVQRADDRITFADVSASGAPSTLTLSDTDPGTFRLALSEAVDRGDVRIDPAAYRPGSLRVEVTSRGAVRWQCQSRADCSIGDLAIEIARDGENYVTTVDLEGGSGIVVVERFADPDPGPPTVAEQIVGSITIDRPASP